MIDKFFLMLFLTNKNKNKIFFNIKNDIKYNIKNDIKNYIKNDIKNSRINYNYIIKQNIIKNEFIKLE
jgi:hypothetical protein